MPKPRPIGPDDLRDPIKFARLLWPHVVFYKQQQHIIYSVVENDETFVAAGNMLGKDFVAGFIALHFFLTRTPCRVVTTSADYAQLEAVLWGEIRRWVQTSKYPLDAEQGGPLVVNHLHIRKVIGGVMENEGKFDASKAVMCPLSYLLGRVAAKGEGMLGHHIAETGDGIPRTFWLCDEASGVEDKAYEAADTWAKRKLVIGNCYPPKPGCTFFKLGVKGGDVVAQS